MRVGLLWGQNRVVLFWLQCRAVSEEPECVPSGQGGLDLSVMLYGKEAWQKVGESLGGGNTAAGSRARLPAVLKVD